MAKAAGKETFIEMSASIKADLNTSDFMKQWATKSNSMGKTLASGIKGALEGGFKSTALNKMVATMDKIADGQSKAALKAAALTDQLTNKNLDDLTKKQVSLQLKQTKIEIADFNKQYKKEKKLMEDRVANGKEFSDLVKKGMGNATQELGEGIKGAFDSLKSGDFSSVAKTFGKVVSTAMGGVTAKTGLGAGDSMLGKIMSGIGPAIIGIGAIIGGFAAVLKILIDADSAAKEINRSLLEGEQTIGDMTDNFDDLGDTLQMVRKQTTNPLFNNLWGTVSKDQVAIINGFMKSGVSIKGMTAGMASLDEQTKAVKGNIQNVLVYSKLLGTSGEEMATTMGEQMTDLGLNVEGIQQRFGAVYDAALTSGFGVKRFYSMVLQATSGMTMYNVRMEEAGGLLINLGKVLGQMRGGEFLKELTGSLKDESMQDRYKRIKTTGEKRSARTFRESAVSGAEGFQKDWGGKLGKTGNEAFKGLDAEGMVKAMQKAQKDGTQGKLIATIAREIEADGGPNAKDRAAAAARALNDLADKANGASGHITDMAKQLDTLDPVGKLQMMTDQAKAISGVSGDMDDIMKKGTAQQIMALSTITGKSVTQLKELGRVVGTLKDEFNTVADLAKEGDQTKNDEMAKAYGLAVGKDKKVHKATVDDAGHAVVGKDVVKDYKAYERQQQNRFKADVTGPAVATDPHLSAAQAVVKNTTDMTKILEQGIEAVLEDIYESTEGMRGFMTGPLLAFMRHFVFGKEGDDMNQMAVKADRETTVRKAVKDAERAVKTAGKDLEEAKKKAEDPNATSQDKNAVADAEASLKKARGDLQVARNVKDKTASRTDDDYKTKAKNVQDEHGINAFADMNAATLELAEAEKAFHQAKSTAVDFGGPNDKKRDAAGAALYEAGQKVNKARDVIKAGPLTDKEVDEKIAAKDQAKAVGVVNEKIAEKDRQDAIKRDKASDEILKNANVTLWAPGGPGTKGLGDYLIKGLEGIELSKALLADNVDATQVAGITQALLMGTEMSASQSAAYKGHEKVGTPYVDPKKLVGAKTEQDFILSMSDGGAVTSIVKHNPNDKMSLVGAKSGGALDMMSDAASSSAGTSTQASRGSKRSGQTVVINNHFYNDAKANFKGVQDALAEVLP